MRRDEEAALRHANDAGRRPDDIVLVAPFTGRIVPLTDVPDPVFAERMFGDGIGMDPLVGELRAPCDGVVAHVARTGHAVTLHTAHGVDILLHVGIDTVHLAGKGFAAKVQEGATVGAGDLLIAFALDEVAREAQSLVSVIAIANSDAFDIVHRATSGTLQVGEGPLLILRARNAAQTSEASASSTPVAGETPRASSRNVTLQQHGGLHARPAARAREAARAFDAQVIVQHGSRQSAVDSVVGLLSLGAGQGATLTLQASGPQAVAALEAVAQALLREEAGGTPPKADATSMTAMDAIVPMASTAPAASAPPGTVAAPAPRQSTGAVATHDPQRLLPGVSAAPGVALGALVHWGQEDIVPPECGIGDSALERAALNTAIAAVDDELASTVQSALKRGAIGEADIFKMHRALLDDPILLDVARDVIGLGKSAGFAWRESIGAQCSLLSKVGDNLLAERVLDLRDLERRVLRVLYPAKAPVLGSASGPASGSASISTSTSGSTQASKPLSATMPDDVATAVILAADDLTPSDLASLDRNRIKGVVMARGGATTHAAILARQFGLPALVAVGESLRHVAEGTTVVLDASAGHLDIAPGPDDLARATAESRRLADARQTDRLASHDIASTRDGTRIEVAANIATCEDAVVAVDNGADGVGLLRTELLFMHRQSAPSVDEHRQSYQAIVDALKGRRAIVRTLDVGADKEVDYLTLPPETNPALGLRGIRLAQIRPDLLDDQLRGMLRVKPADSMRILLPMVTDVGEVVTLRERIDTLTLELAHDDPAQPADRTNPAVATVRSGRVEVGVMIEVPSAALLADQLAQHADFLSIGTNDLTQYTLAMDRGQADLAARADGLHPAVLRLIEATVTGATRHGKWVGVCGALASDPVAVPLLIGLGVTELSVDPAAVPGIKALVRRLDLSHCRTQAETALTLLSAQAVRAASRAAFS